jgi:hypothetical protein
MKIRNVVYTAALLVATAGITSTVVSQNAKDKSGQQPPMTPEMQAMMQKCMEAGTPGENHKLLEKKVGTWNGVVKMWMTPDVPEPEQSNCTANVKWIMDGRYLSENVEGDFGGQTFLGSSWSGYDNVAKKFFWVWIDNMSTGKMDATGTFNPGTKTFTYTSGWSCPMTGKHQTGRSVEKWIDNDHMVMEMYGPWFETGKEYKMMEIAYTRTK